MNANFPEPHIHLPQDPHTHTAILLHGRGSNGPESAEELFSSSTSAGQNLPSHLPTWRWVFPTSKDLWNDRFQEELCAWFDAYSLDDITERRESQVPGLRESVSYVLDVLGKELELLNGKTTHVYLGGISQGMATAMWTWFCASSKVQGSLGGVLGFCGWMPFAERFEYGDLDRGGRLVEFYYPMVTVELGRQVIGIMKRAGMEVEWLEYVGAEGDGHWIKAPEGFDAILKFLQSGKYRVKG
ncbi:phospholipase/carboxylesterase family protein [Aspergillus luchuensis IFO 4308]|nr:phospholipase/carboxylesterase family protein [Aspergillus luchuensis IFO 4308]